MKRLLTILFVLALIGAAVLWILHEPYQPDRLYDAIPEQVTYFSIHENLGERLDGIVRNPLTIGLLSSAGVDADELLAMFDEPVVKAWLPKVLTRRAVLAQLPPEPGFTESSWLFGTWIGGNRKVVDMLLSAYKDSGLEKSENYRGRNIWVYRDPEALGGLGVAFVFDKGMMLGSVSPDTGALRRMLDALDGQVGSLGRESAVQMDQLAAWAGEAPDAGFGKVSGGAMDGPLLFRFDAFDEFHVDAWVQSPAVAPALPPLKEAAQPQELARLFGDIPLTMIVTQPEHLQYSLSMADQAGVPQMLQDLISAEGAGPVSLALVGGKFSGRLKGLKVPALLAAMQFDDHMQALKAAEKAVDQINAEYNLGLVPERVQAGDAIVYALQGTQDNAYKIFSGSERVAYASFGSWLLVCSNLRTLTRVIGQYGERPGPVSWATDFSAQDHSGFGWMNVTETGDTLRQALAAYTLKMMFSGAAQEEIDRINTIKTWIGALIPLETLRVWQVREGAFNQLHMTIGTRKDGLAKAQLEDQG